MKLISIKEKKFDFVKKLILVWHKYNDYASGIITVRFDISHLIHLKWNRRTVSIFREIIKIKAYIFKNNYTKEYLFKKRC